MKPPGLKPYNADWSDRSRDLANICFLTGYLLLLMQQTVLGAGVYLLGEVFLVPHCIKCQSWSTLVTSSIFAFFSAVTILGFIFSVNLL
jgi:hypothetical protein